MKPWLSLLLLAATAASPVQYFQYQRPVLNPPASATQACLVLDAEVFANASPGLADLRLFRDNSETPFVIQVAAPVESSEKSLAPLNLGLHAKDTVFDAAMPEGNYSDIQLEVTAQNFIATVNVTGRHALTGGPETRLGHYTIFDLTRQKLGRSTVLHLPESNFRYLRFQIAGAIPPEKITGITVVREPSVQAQYESVAQSIKATQQDRHTVFEFTIPAHVPVDHLVFAPGSEPASFSRDVSITVTPSPPKTATDATEPPQPVTSSGNILRIHSLQDGHRLDDERLALDAPAAVFDTPEEWVVSIDNGDDAPLIPLAVSLEMLRRQLCFDSVAGAHYRLYYGDPSLTSPHYDYATLFVPRPDASRVVAGPQQQNPDYRSRPDTRPFTERHPALLWFALVLVIAVLAGVALRPLLRKPIA